MTGKSQQTGRKKIETDRKTFEQKEPKKNCVNSNMTVFFTFEREAEKRREPKYGHHGLQNLELTKLLWHKQIQTKIHLHMYAYLCVHVKNRDTSSRA